MYEEVGNLWNDLNKIIISDGNKFYVLNNWNGEKWFECWEVKDNKGFYPVDERKYTIRPVFEEIEEDEFEIVDYEIE